MRAESHHAVVALPDTARRRVVEAFRSGSDTPGDARSLLEELISAEAPLLDRDSVVRCSEELVGELLGLGALEGLMAQEGTTDVLVDGPGEVWVEREGRLGPSGVHLGRSEVDALVERLVAPMGLRADRSHPVVDARRPDGTRVAVVMPPVAPAGPIIALRRHARRSHPLEDYADTHGVALLRAAVRQRRNVLVYGPTGAGKTSLLSSLCGCVDARERVVVVEDTAELCFEGPPTARLEARATTVEGDTGTGMATLVRAALRLRPDRIVVGEVRGAEAAEMIWALSTGHRGSMATVHAGDPLEALDRVEVMVVAGQGGAVPLRAVRKQVHSALDVLVGMARDRAGRRRVVRIDGCGRGGLSRLDGPGGEE